MHNSTSPICDLLRQHEGSLSAAFLEKLILAFETIAAEDISIDDLLGRLFDGLHGDDSIPAYPNINLIPSREDALPGTCHPLCVVNLEVPNTWSSSTSTDVLSELRHHRTLLMILTASHWFRCMSINKETLMLCTSWNEQEFAMDSLALVRSYEDHDKKVFIVELTKNGPVLRYPYLS